jgi:hypothetical protein
MTDYPQNEKITIHANVASGGPITTNVWKIDDVQQNNNTATLTINPYQLSAGAHTIKCKGQNYCGNWTGEITESINIIAVKYSQTDPLIMKQPVMDTTVKLRRF